MLRARIEFYIILYDVAKMFIGILSLKCFFLLEKMSDLLELLLWRRLYSGLKRYLDLDNILLSYRCYNSLMDLIVLLLLKHFFSNAFCGSSFSSFFSVSLLGMGVFLFS